AVLKDDIIRSVASSQVDTNAVPRLEITLLKAFAQRDFRSLRSTPIRAEVALHVSIVSSRTARILWSQEILGQEVSTAAYITSQVVEETLNQAYCRALEE